MDRDSEILKQAMTRVSEMEHTRLTMLSKIKELEEYCLKKDNFMQAKVMIIKLQQAKIERLKAKGNETTSEKIKDLEEHVKILTYSIEHHPGMLKFAVQNNDLRELIQRMAHFRYFHLNSNQVSFYSLLGYEKAFGEEMSEYQNEITQYSGFFSELADRNLKLFKEKKLLMEAMKKKRNGIFRKKKTTS